MTRCGLIVLTTSGLIAAEMPAPAQALFDRYVTAWNTRELAALAACFTPDARIVASLPGDRNATFTVTTFVAEQRAVFAEYPDVVETLTPVRWERTADGSLIVHARWQTRWIGGSAQGANRFTIAGEPPRITALSFTVEP